MNINKKKIFFLKNFRSALSSCLATFLKRYASNIKIGKYDLDKFPTFLNKKKSKKQPEKLAKGHSFFEKAFPIKSVCAKCNYPFWGIGLQGYQCQSIILNSLSFDEFLN